MKVSRGARLSRGAFDCTMRVSGRPRPPSPPLWRRTAFASSRSLLTGRQCSACWYTLQLRGRLLPVCLFHLPCFMPVSASKPPCLWGLQSYWTRAHPNDLILTGEPLWRLYFPKRSHSDVLGFKTSTYFFWQQETMQSITCAFLNLRHTLFMRVYWSV